jgi:hypothetical protein
LKFDIICNRRTKYLRNSVFALQLCRFRRFLLRSSDGFTVSFAPSDRSGIILLVEKAFVI